jgi:hypothetical protein
MRGPSALFPFLFLLALAAAPRLSAAGPGAQWPEGEWFCEWGPAHPGCANPDGAGSLVETARMKLGADAAPWLLPFVVALMKKRPWAYHAETLALFSGEAGAQYLVVEWDAPRASGPGIIEFHKVLLGTDGRRRLEWLRSLDYPYADISALSGRTLIEGEAPVVVVNLMDTGSAPYINKVRLIQLKRNSVDITPDWAGRVVNVVDLDGDGQFEVVTDNDHLVVMYNTLVNGPFRPVILTRTGGDFVPDCRRFHGLFEDRSRSVESFALGQSDDPLGQLSWFTEAFLGFLQAGAFDDARRTQRRIASLAKEHPLVEFSAEQLDEDLASVLDWAINHPEKSCPASAPDNPGGPNGALLRSDIYLDRLKHHSSR